MRLLGITIPEGKRLEYGLTELYGIGLSTSRKILADANLDFGILPKDVSTEAENKIRKTIETMKLEGTLKREVSAHIKRLKDIKSYRGVRHLKRLPVRGQRTKTNSRTIRGNVRKTMASGRRKLEKT
jgi:small subunit ribosomal protein S13